MDKNNIECHDLRRTETGGTNNKKKKTDEMKCPFIFRLKLHNIWTDAINC